jgi:hypothetical protein
MIQLGRVAVITVLLGAAFTGGCSSANSSGSSAQSQGVSGSRVKLYHSVSELATDSSSVAVVSATGTQRVETVDGDIPFTVTTVNVKQVLGGVDIGTTVDVRQLGSSGAPGEVPLMQSGHTYVVYLAPFHFTPGDSTGQWTIVGAGAGLFEMSGATLKHLDPQTSDLNSVTTIQPVKDSAASASRQP